MGPRRPPSLGEPACCGAVRPAPGGSRVMARPGGASPWSSGRARYGACGPVPAGPCGRERPSPAGRRVSPGRVAGGRWSVGRTECCGPVLLGSRDPLSGTAGGGLDSHAWSWGPVTARFGNRDSVVRGGLRRAGPPGLVLRAGFRPAGRLRSVVRGVGLVRAGPPRLVLRAGRRPAGRLRSLSGAAGPVRARPATGCFPERTGQGTACRCCPPLLMRCEPGLPDRASVLPAAAGPGGPWPGLGAAHRPVRAGACRGPRATGCRAAAGAWAAAGAGLLPGLGCCRGQGCCRIPGPGRRCPARRRQAGPSCRCRATRPRPRRATRPRPRRGPRRATRPHPRWDPRRATRPHPRPEPAADGTLVPPRRASPQEQGRLAPGARTAARWPAVLQIRIAHSASVFLLAAPHGAVRHFSLPGHPVTRSRDGCPHLGCSPGYPRAARDDARPGHRRWAGQATGGGHPSEGLAGHAGAYRMLRFAVTGVGRYPYLTSMSISMPAVPRFA